MSPPLEQAAGESVAARAGADGMKVSDSPGEVNDPRAHEYDLDEQRGGRNNGQIDGEAEKRDPSHAVKDRGKMRVLGEQDRARVYEILGPCPPGGESVVDLIEDGLRLFAVSSVVVHDVSKALFMVLVYRPRPLRRFHVENIEVTVTPGAAIRHVEDFAPSPASPQCRARREDEAL